MGAGESNLANTSLGQYAMKSRDVAVGVLRSVTAGGTTGTLARVEVSRVLKGEGTVGLWERPLVESGKPADLDRWEQFIKAHDAEAKRRVAQAEKKVAQGRAEEAPAPLRDPWALIFFDQQGYLSGYALQRLESAATTVSFDKLALDLFSVGQPRKRFIPPHISVSHFTMKQANGKFVVSYRGPLCFLMGGRGVAADRLVTVETDTNAEITHMEPWVRNLRLPGTYEKAPPTVVFAKHLTLEYGDKTRPLTLSGVVGRESDRVEGEDLGTVSGIAAASANSSFHLPIRMWVTRPLLLSSWALEHYALHKEFDSVYYVLLLQLRTNKDTNTTDYKMRGEFRLGFFTDSKVAPAKDWLVGMPDTVTSLPMKLIRTEAPPEPAPGAEETAAASETGPSLVFGADTDGSVVGGLMSMVSFSELKLNFETPRKRAFVLPTHSGNEPVLHSVLQHCLVRPLAITSVSGYGLDGATGLLQLRAVVFFNSVSGLARWVLVDSAMQPILGKHVDFKQPELTAQGVAEGHIASPSPFPLEEPPQAVVAPAGAAGGPPSAPPRFIAHKPAPATGGPGAIKKGASISTPAGAMGGGGVPDAPTMGGFPGAGPNGPNGPNAPGLKRQATPTGGPAGAAAAGGKSPSGASSPSGPVSPPASSAGGKLGAVAQAKANLAAASGAAVSSVVKGSGSGNVANPGGPKQAVQLRSVSGLGAPRETAHRVEDDWKEYMGWYDEDGEWVSGSRDKWGNWVTGYYDAAGRWVGGFYDPQDHWHYDSEFVEPRPVLRHVETNAKV